MTTLAFTQQLARRVGALLQREQARATYGYKHRNPKDWVSEVDTLSERTIVRAISRVYPAHGVLSEEAPFPEHRRGLYLSSPTIWGGAKKERTAKLVLPPKIEVLTPARGNQVTQTLGGAFD